MLFLFCAWLHRLYLSVKFKFKKKKKVQWFNFRQDSVFAWKHQCDAKEVLSEKQSERIKGIRVTKSDTTPALTARYALYSVWPHMATHNEVHPCLTPAVWTPPPPPPAQLHNSFSCILSFVASNDLYYCFVLDGLWFLLVLFGFVLLQTEGVKWGRKWANAYHCCPTLRCMWASSARPCASKLICMKQREYLCFYADLLRMFQELLLFLWGCLWDCEIVGGACEGMGHGGLGSTVMDCTELPTRIPLWSAKNNITSHHEDAHYVQLLKLRLQLNAARPPRGRHN